MSVGKCSLSAFLLLHLLLSIPFTYVTEEICHVEERVSPRAESLSVSSAFLSTVCDGEETQGSAESDGQEPKGKTSEEDHPCGFRGMSSLEARDPSSAQADPDASQAKLTFVVGENRAVNCMDKHQFYSTLTCLLLQNNFPTKK